MKGWSVVSRKKQSERMKALHADPDFKAKLRAGIRGVEVPAWVERAGLVDDYVSVARESDEIDAAAHCRRLLRELRA